MFSSSFTMSEQQHRQWTPYKQAAPALRAAFALSRPAARSARASRNLRRDLQFGLRGPREKCCAGMKAKRSTPCPMTGSGRKEQTTMRRRFKCDPKWITVRYPAKCAEPNCQTEIKFRRASVLLPQR